MAEVAADHVTVLTRHFSKFFVSAIPRRLLDEVRVTTDFAPGRDDWPLPNYGSYCRPSGTARA